MLRTRPKPGFLLITLLQLINSFLTLADNSQIVCVNKHLYEIMGDITYLFNLYFPEDKLQLKEAFEQASERHPPQKLLTPQQIIREVFKQLYERDSVYDRSLFRAFKEGNLATIHAYLDWGSASDKRFMKIDCNGRTVFFYLKQNKHTTLDIYQYNSDKSKALDPKKLDPNNPHYAISLWNYFYEERIRPFRLGPFQFAYNSRGSAHSLLVWAIFCYLDENELSNLFNQSKMKDNSLFTRSQHVYDFGSAQPIHMAALTRNMTAIRFLIKQPGVNINATASYNSQTALHIAAKEGYLDVVEFLVIQPTIDLNRHDLHGDNALFHAVKEGRLSIVKVLCEKTNADINILLQGFLPYHNVLSVTRHVLHLAVASDNKELFPYLYARKGITLDPHVRYQMYGITCDESVLLHLAVKARDLNFVKLICETGKVDINALASWMSDDNGKQTALSLAYIYDKSDSKFAIINYLCSRPDIRLKDSKRIIRYNYLYNNKEAQDKKSLLNNAYTCEKLRTLTDAYRQHLTAERDKPELTSEQKSKIQIKLNKLETLREIVRLPANVCARATIQRFYDQFKGIERDLCLHRDKKSKRYRNNVLTILSLAGIILRPFYSYYKTGSFCFWQSQGKRLSSHLEDVCKRSLKAA